MSDMPAILLYRPGPVSWERQYLACVPYLLGKGYTVAGIAQDEDDAVALVHTRRASVVVVAAATENDEQLQARLKAVGGRLEHCRQSRFPRSRPQRTDTEDLVARMLEAGLTMEQIVTVTRRPRSRVRAILDRLRGSAAPLVPALMMAVVGLSDLGEDLLDLVT